MGLPVAKRAKHGIHFQRPDGLIQADFTGKPVHYLDGATWKPIDTKLVALGDGYYGCPHSKVKVHPDGTVKMAGTDYVQRVALPSAKTGLLDGDKLVRTFSFGEQRMWITEDGFKSEIQLNRIPTLTEARKLIATESGTLSKEYLKSLTTATDANGSVHTYSTLTAFRTWLAQAVFPVIIDPDFSTTSTAGDTALRSTDATRNFGASVLSKDALTQRLLFRFDLSSITASAICSAATFKITKSDTGSATLLTHNLFKIADANGDWIEGTTNNATAKAGEPCWNAKVADGSAGVTTAWAGSAGMSTAGTDYINTIIGTAQIQRSDASNTQYTFTLNSDGLEVLQSWFGDVTNNGILYQSDSLSYLSITFHLSEATTESYRPVLSVTYTAGGGITPIVQYYNQLRRNK